MSWPSYKLAVLSQGQPLDQFHDRLNLGALRLESVVNANRATLDEISKPGDGRLRRPLVGRVD
jgi:hypothetical protein